MILALLQNTDRWASAYSCLCGLVDYKASIPSASMCALLKNQYQSLQMTAATHCNDEEQGNSQFIKGTLLTTHTLTHTNV